MTGALARTNAVPGPIVARTRGSGRGGITRPMDTADLGRRLTPFVLDLFDADLRGRDADPPAFGHRDGDTFPVTDISSVPALPT